MSGLGCNLNIMDADIPVENALWARTTEELVPNGCLSAYLKNNLSRTKRILPGNIAHEDFQIFFSNVTKLTKQLDSFLTTRDQQIAFLILGKIQSGKTAHLLSTIAWAADNSIAFTTIFTGTNNALNNQTIKRIKNDLSNSIDGSYIKVFEVPTNTNGKSFHNLFNEVCDLLDIRLLASENSISRKMPVFVTMKNPTRIRTLIELTSKLLDKYGDKMTTLLIDDEADQASPNAKAQDKEVSATYKAIAELRSAKSEIGCPNRNILLSYTATPQAVLLSEVDSELRPNFCVTISPRAKYFGINQIVGVNFENNRKAADDWDGNLEVSENNTRSLFEAIVTFILTSWIRQHHPNVFYGSSNTDQNLYTNRLNSTQMLIHESHKKSNHEEVHELVYEVQKRLKKCLNAYCVGNLTEDIVSSDIEIIKKTYQSILRNAPENCRDYLPKFIDIDVFRQLHNLLDSSENIVVNSSGEKVGFTGDVPVEDRDWEGNIWFVIGGNILGRGLTIPQLTTSYFVRHAKTPNFDTISQHMRFCGYREDYSHFVYLFAQQITYDTFEVMQEIETVVWKMAENWSDQKLDISKNIPNVLYASKTNVRLEPTRKSIQDPDLKDVVFKDKIISLTNIASPQQMKSNLKLITMENMGQLGDINKLDNFFHISVKNSSKFLDLIANWQCDSREYEIKNSVCGLFDENLGSLGLMNFAVDILVDESLVNFEISDFIDEQGLNVSESMLKRHIYSRGTNQVMADSNLQKWIEDFNNADQDTEIDTSWPRINVPHIGDSQREDRNKIGDQNVFLIIEPMFVHVKGNESRKVGFGIAFTIQSPKGYDVRLIGMPSRVAKFDIGE